MKKIILGAIIASISLVFIASSSMAYEIFGGPTQLIQYKASKAQNGYTLFSAGKKSYLIDMMGEVVHTWDLPGTPGLHLILLPNGHLFGGFRPEGKKPAKHFQIGGVTGGLVELDWDSNIVWKAELMTEKANSHHDFVLLPNGNVMFNVWEHVSKEEAVKAGRDPAQTTNRGVVYDCIYEINRKGKVVWKWSSWDHRGAGLDKLDVNYINYVLPEYEHENQDWTHFNDVDYDPATDTILCDSREFGELYIIDHKTGKILYRWGNPSVYGAGDPPTFSTPGDQKLFGPHDTHFIDPGLPGAGNILIFNNGWGRPPITYSSIVEMNPKTDEIVWEFKSKAETAFAAHHISGSQRLPNGNTFICSGNWGHLFEVTKEGEVVWEYIVPNTSREGIKCWLDDAPFAVGPGSNSTFRAHRYLPDYPAFEGKDLTPKGQVAGDCPDAWKPRIE